MTARKPPAPCPGPGAPDPACGAELAGRALRCPLCGSEAQRRQAAAWRARRRRERNEALERLIALLRSWLPT